MRAITVNFNEQDIKRVDLLVEAGEFPNRGEAVRQLLKEGLVVHEGLVKKQEYNKGVRY